jgi:hypothetical protein
MSAIFGVIAGLALVATWLILFPLGAVRGLVKNLALTTSLAVIAAVLITAARAFGP